MASLSPRIKPCARRPDRVSVTPQQKGHLHGFMFVCTEKIAQGSATGYKDVFVDSERVLMLAVAQQPVSIAIEADQSSFQSCFAVGRVGRREGAGMKHQFCVRLHSLTPVVHSLVIHT